MERKMYLMSPPNRMKKRPHEDSYTQRQEKNQRLVDLPDGAIGETEEVLTTPPIKMNKRPCVDSGKQMLRKTSPAVGCAEYDSCEKAEIFLFRILLPNGTCVEMKLRESRNTIEIEEFIDMVKKQHDLLVSQKRSSELKRRIMWEYPDLYFTDAQSKKIQIQVELCKFGYAPNVWHLLWLHDGSAEPDEYEDMWDLTPDTELLKELPDDYTCETALADLIDNSLQALWSNGEGERRLISVEMHPGKITIFDTAPGMDGATGKIVKWGKMGASLHRSVREKAIGGEPPYLMPFFGMFGYGGPVATMCLGRRAVVSSKTKESNKVFTLHMEREALVSASHTENCWKTKGGVRDPSEKEKRSSRHGSFTKVEIFDTKPEVNEMHLKHLRYKLKDIYFPYIQCDEVSGKTSRPIEFRVNKIDLAEVEGGEVAITNLHSCNGPDFVVQLHFRIRPGSSKSDQNQRVCVEANARLKCVYYPIIEDKENIERILEKLDKDGYEIRESFESFSRVSVRRLGRLLPDIRWPLLPFMEPKLRRGEKAQVFRRICSRVKCFIDTDSGFNPTPHKTDLAHHHPYTKALKNFGNRSLEDEKEVQVEIVRDGKKLTVAQLQNLYHDWISEMHDRYDVEVDSGSDKPTIILTSSKIDKLDLSSDVLRVHKEIQRKGRCWKAGQNIKVLKGACRGCHKANVYATLEFIIFEGLQGDASGEARLICRPLGLPAKRSCSLLVGEGNTIITINESWVFPIRIIDCEKCIPVDDDEWRMKLDSFNQKLPASIELLSHTDCQELEIDGGLPISLESGYSPPENIVAVIRPKSFDSEKCSKRLDQKFIVRDDTSMTLDLKYRAREGAAGDFSHVYSASISASSHKGLNGLYVFPLREKLPLLFRKPGRFIFSFSLREFKDMKLRHIVQVQPSAGLGRWKVLNQDKNELYTVRVGSCFKPLSIACYDRHNKRVLFSSVPKLCIKLISCGKTIAQVRSQKVDITPDKLIMKIKDFFITCTELIDIRPSYEATLHISTLDEAFSVDFPCRVVPGAPKRIAAHPTKIQEQVLPGQVIEELELEVFDDYGNHVKEGERILLRLDGFSFQDGSGVISGTGIDCIKKVDANSRIDLSNVLKVSRGYDKQVWLSVISKDNLIFELKFETERRELRPVQKVFKNCEVGSLLENIEFEIIDSGGEVDETINDEDKHGQSHTLTIQSKSFCVDGSARYKFYHGRCTIPSIPLPHREGVFSFSAGHSRYPELKVTMEVHVEKMIHQDNHVSLMDHEDFGNPFPERLSENELIPRSGSTYLLHTQAGASASPVTGRLSYSALISQEVCLEKTPQDNHEDVEDALLSPQSSSVHEQFLLVTPSLKEPQVTEEAFSPRRSEGFVLPMRDSLALMTPELEHTNAQCGDSDLGELPVSNSAVIAQDKICSLKELEDNLANSGLKMFHHHRSLDSLYISQAHIQQEVSRLQAELGPDLCNALSLCGQQSVLEQIENTSQSAAAVICKTSEEELSHHDILGVVALLGTVGSIELSRMLSQYLGEDQMIAIVCRNYAASSSLETTTLHMFATKLGHSINGGYLALCLEDIRPWSRELSIDPQELLPLQYPTLPNGKVPQGYLGYAVNLISIEPSYLQWKTKTGHGLRETLFYRLFGELQVYKNRDCMMAAQSCINAGAVSLDGGLMKGNGLICLGHWEPRILFPVMNSAMSADKLRMLKNLEAEELRLEKINERVEEEYKEYCRWEKELRLCRDMYNSFRSQQGGD